MVRKKGICYWITGLSGSGKSTVSEAFSEMIRNDFKNIILLDGDNLRVIFNNKSFSNEDRLKLSYKYALTANMLLDQGIHVVISVMALFHEVHKWNRENISNYVEVFLDVPIQELERRDPKGLYLKYKRGEVKNMVGMDIMAEFPENPHFHFSWNKNQDLKSISDTLYKDFRNRILI